MGRLCLCKTMSLSPTPPPPALSSILNKTPFIDSEFPLSL